MIDLLKQLASKADWMKTITGLIILCVFGTLVFVLINKEIPQGNREIIIHVLGIIEGAVMAIVSYYYGSSKGSQQKQEMINEKFNN